METRKEEAARKKRSGLNCAQAVACTYCDYAGIDEETMANITQAFGAGMGTMEGTCGAISGACAVIGMVNSKNGRSQNSKAKTMKDTREIVNAFLNQNKSITCKDLKGIETGVVLRSCEDCVRDAAELLEKTLENKKKNKIQY